jgi:hypothetical protein
MAGSDDETGYLIRVPAVRASITRLLEQRIHPIFPAYLHLRQQSARQGSLTAIRPTWTELGDLLRVPGGPVGKPHYRPFWNRRSEAGQAWLGPNLAGSYSPSSLRTTKPARVLDTNPDGSYVLRDRHWELAGENLTDGERVPALALASYLLRNYAILSESDPTRDDLVNLFLGFFGYQSPADDEEVAYLYDRDWHGPDDAWFESPKGEAG